MVAETGLYNAYDFKSHHSAEEGGFWAEVPALPGCLTQAETLDELEINLREAIELWLSVDDEVTESNANDKVLELTV